MSETPEFTKIPVGAIRALSGHEEADFAVFLQHQKGAAPALFRPAGADLGTPDFKQLREFGLTCLHIQSGDLHRCESIIESRLREVLQQGEGTLAERTQLVAHVGTTVARDLCSGPEPDKGLSRATQLLDGVTAGILSDSQFAANILNMSAHEAGVAGHMFMVSVLAIIFGREVLGADQKALRELGLAGMTHDIGKLGITSELLCIKGELSDEEHQLIQQHPIESVRMLRDDPAVTDNVRRSILEHHERVDGRGYPLGLAKADLSVGGRLLAIVDTFHAVIGRRGGRTSTHRQEALQMIQRHAGLQFDADLARCWCDFLDRARQSSQLASIANTAEGGTMLSPRHEHRAAVPRRNTFGTRAKRLECHTRRTVSCIYAGRLCAPEQEQRAFTATLRDASRSGMCIFTPQPMYRGEILSVSVDGGPQRTWVRGVVGWCRRHDSSCFRVGIQFLQRITPEETQAKVPVRTMAELEEALHQAIASSRIERRDRPRLTVPADDDDVEQFGAAGVLEAARQARNVSSQLENEVIQVSASGERDSRAESIGVLAKINSRAARTALAVMLDDNDTEVRAKAIEAVGLLEMQEASGRLRQILKDEDEACVLRAASALAQLGDKSAVPAVVDVVERDGPNVRLAARILGTMIGQRFAANTEGVRAARRYIQASALKGVV